MPERFLKHGNDTVAADIVNEMVRLRWLAGRIAGPALIRCEVTADTVWLLTTGLPERTAWQILDAEPARADEVVDALADFLRSLHAVPVSDCPFAAAHARIDVRPAQDRFPSAAR